MVGAGDWRRGRGGAVGREVRRSFCPRAVRVEFGQRRGGSRLGRGDLFVLATTVMVVVVVVMVVVSSSVSVFVLLPV